MRRLLAVLLLLWLPVGVAPAQPADPQTLTEQQILDLSNQTRVQNGLTALTGEPNLQRAAREHSQEMASLNYFDHESPTPGLRFPWDRVNKIGFDSVTIEENLYFAEGYPLASVANMAIKAWMHSEDHRRNLLSTQVSRIGIGVAVKGQQTYVTQVFSAEVEPVTSQSTVDRR